MYKIIYLLIKLLHIQIKFLLKLNFDKVNTSLLLYLLYNQFIQVIH